MVYRYSRLLSASYYIGLILLIGGWSIFILWLAGRYLYAIDLEILVLIGSQWVFFGFFVGLIGILFIIIYTILNFRILHWEIALYLLILLINIPSIFVISKWHLKVENKAFVKLINNTSYEDLEFTFNRGSKAQNIGVIDVNESKYFHYEPKIEFYNLRYHQQDENLGLIIQNSNMKDTIEFPELDRGSCVHIYLNKHLDLEVHYQTYWNIQ